MYGPVAQLVEQRIENPRVGGSIPSQATSTLFSGTPESPKKAVFPREAAFFIAHFTPLHPTAYRKNDGTFDGISDTVFCRYRQEVDKMPLTDTAVKNAKPDPDKPAGREMADGQGLYLLVKETGKYWRYDYRFAGKRKTLALGVYPAVSLAAARKAREAARAQLDQGIDPAMHKRLAKATAGQAAANTFEATTREFHQVQRSGWSEGYAHKWLRLMEKNLFPLIDPLPLLEITPPVLLEALPIIEGKGIHDTAHTLRQQAGQVFRYGIQTGRCERDPVPDLKGALRPYTPQHMAAVLEPVEVAGLLRAVDGYTGAPATKAALQLSALLFQRPYNIRAMQWAWISWDEAMLTIPAEEMKRRLDGKVNGKPHLVPLARQALEVLRGIQLLTGRGQYVFPGARSSQRPMSGNTVVAALRRLGYTGEEMTAHGFRAMARTLIAEQMPDIHHDVIEAQLAHGKSGVLGAAYDRAQYLQQRRRMMQFWADYLDQLRQGAEVLQIHQPAA